MDVLIHIPNETIHLTFTSPPYYNAKEYSTYSSYEEYLDFLKSVFGETHRITKEGRFLIVNTSPVITPRRSRSHSSKRHPIPFDLNTILVNSGWDFVDDIVWIKPEASVKNRIGIFTQHKTPLTYKPNLVTEYIMVYRKKTDKLIDWNLKEYDKQTIEKSKIKNDYESSNVWNITPKSDKIHPAIFPPELCEKIISYYSFVGDLIFDPFAGSGTVGKVARKLDRHFFMTEKNKTYFNYIKSGFKSLLEDEPIHFFNTENFIKFIKP